MGGPDGPEPKTTYEYESTSPDDLFQINAKDIGVQGMKIDRMFFEKFEDKVKEDPFLQKNVQDGRWDQVLDYVKNQILNKPEEFFTVEKLRKAAEVDRRLTLREILEKAFGFIPYFKNKDELLEEEFQKFLADYKPEDPQIINPMKYFFKAYASDSHLRGIIDKCLFAQLNVNPTFGMRDFKAIPDVWRKKIPEYIKDYVPLNQFMQ